MKTGAMKLFDHFVFLLGFVLRLHRVVLKVKTNRFFLILKCLEQLYKVIESEKSKIHSR